MKPNQTSEYHAARTPDVEFTRRMKNGSTRGYGHIYWKPLIVVIFGRVIVGKKHLS